MESAECDAQLSAAPAQSECRAGSRSPVPLRCESSSELISPLALAILGLELLPELVVGPLIRPVGRQKSLRASKLSHEPVRADSISRSSEGINRHLGRKLQQAALSPPSGSPWSKSQRMMPSPSIPSARCLAVELLLA